EHVRRRVQEREARAVARDRDRVLGPRLPAGLARPRRGAAPAGAVPLRKPAPRGGAEHDRAHRLILTAATDGEASPRSVTHPYRAGGIDDRRGARHLEAMAMQWTRPSATEIKMDAEISSYQG